MTRFALILCLSLLPAAAAAQGPVDAQDPNAPPSAQDPAPAPSAPLPSDPAPSTPPPSAPVPTAEPETPDWMAPLKDADRNRIRNLAASREAALALADTGKADEVRITRELLAAPAQPLDPGRLAGRWRCRSFQLGGILPLTVNPFFACRIRREGSALWLEKTSGSVLRRARLDPIDGTRMLMFGSYRAAGDKVQPYGADDYRDEVGILERIGARRLRVELPEPRAYNSARHEVIELVQ
jgi:hypothetical protein